MVLLTLAVGQVLMIDGAAVAKDASAQSRDGKLATASQLDEITVTTRRQQLLSFETSAVEVISFGDIDFPQEQLSGVLDLPASKPYSGQYIQVRGLNSRGKLSGSINTIKFATGERDSYFYNLADDRDSLTAEDIGLIGAYNYKAAPQLYVGTASTAFSLGELGGCPGTFSPTDSTNLELDKSTLQGVALDDFGVSDKAWLGLRGQFLMNVGAIGGSPAVASDLYSDGTGLSTAISGEDLATIDKLSTTAAGGAGLALMYKFK